jgi:hypothetical protein
MALILWHEWQHVLCIYALGQDNFERFSGLATATQQPTELGWCSDWLLNDYNSCASASERRGADGIDARA